MKVIRQNNMREVSFGNIERNTLFEYNGVLYMKIGISGEIKNCARINSSDQPGTFSGHDLVNPVSTMSYTLESESDQ